jgi:hypothetical protein
MANYEFEVDSRRVSLNLRIDPSKYELLEKERDAGFGVAHTKRNRSDVYNEMIGLGIQIHLLKKELGDKKFEQLWRIMNSMNMSKVHLDKVEIFMKNLK